MNMNVMTTDEILSDGMLQDFAQRVAGYDRDNCFFNEDFEDLRKAGHLTTNGRILPAGGFDPFILAVFAWALTGFGSILLRRCAARGGAGDRGGEQEDLARGQPDHGLSPRSTACRRGNDAGCGPGRPTSGAGRAGLERRRRSWGHVAVQDPLGQVPCRRSLLEDRRHSHEGLGRCGHVQGERARTTVPGRPPWSFQSRQCHCLSTRSWARRRWALTSASSRAGAEPGTASWVL